LRLILIKVKTDRYIIITEIVIGRLKELAHKIRGRFTDFNI